MDIITPAEIRYMQEHINDNKQPLFLALTITTLIVAYIAVFLRFFTRKRWGVLLAADDWWILTALFIATGANIAIFLNIHYGFGRHVILVTHPALLFKSILAAQLLYCCTIVPIKFSMLCLYRRLFPSRKYYITLMTVGGFVLAYSSAEAITLIFRCKPVSSLWSGKPGNCIELNRFYTTMAALNAATDVLIVCMPIPIFWRLKVSNTQKIQLYAIFALGGCVCVFGMIRTAQTDRSTWDPTWGQINFGIWSMLEMNIGVTSACLPTLRPLFSKKPPPPRRPSGKAAAPSPSPIADVEMTGKPVSSRSGGSGDEVGDQRPLVR